MRNLLSLLIVSFTFVLSSYSNTIAGKIKDANTSSPLDYVSVAIFKQGSETLVAGISTSNNGKFLFENIDNGKYTIRISFMGYMPVRRNILLNVDTLNLGEIALKEDSKTLSEVEVLGQGSQMKFDVDKRIFTVDQNIAAAGGSATDVLRNIPSVKVDNEGNISLRKDANVQVWVNGKPSGLTAENRAQILEQMPAGSIESIEIMTNPSAKFNPEGTAGIINLVMKKDRKAGYYGSVSSGVMYPTDGKVGGTAGANINYSSSKIDAYANVGYRRLTMQGGGSSNTYNNEDSLLATTRFDKNNIMENAMRGLFFRAGIDYHLNAKNTIGLSGFGMSGGRTTKNNTNYLLTDFPNVANISQNYSLQNNRDGKRPNMNLNLDYRRDFDKKGTNLLASVSYSSAESSYRNDIVKTDTILESYLIQKLTGTEEGLVFKVDYTNKFTETSRFETGWQSSITDRFSGSNALDSIANIALPTYRNDFDYKEQIHAGYITYGDRLDKLSLQVGLRAEYLKREATNTIASVINGSDSLQNVISPATLQLFPSMYLAYSLPKNNELQLNFTRRVNRPRGRQINPFRDLTDATNISYGNPGLMPEYSSALEFNYMKTWDDHTLSASAYYRFTDGGIEDVRFRKNDSVMEKTYMNISQKQNTGLEIVGKNKLFKILNLTSTLNFYYGTMNPSVYTNPYNATQLITIPGISTFSWSANLIANVMFSKTLSGQITGEYDSRTVIAQGFKGEEYRVDLGLRKTLFDRKLSLNFIAHDVFNLNRERTETWGDGFRQRSVSYFHGRMIGLTVSCNFGNMKPKQGDGKKKDGGSEMNIDGGME